MSPESRRMAGILLITLPSVMYGGISILRLLLGNPAFSENALHHDLWRAGHAHAGVFLLLSLVVLRYADEATFGSGANGMCASQFPALLYLFLWPSSFLYSHQK